MAGKSYEQIVDQIGELKVTELASLVKALQERFQIEMPTAVAAAPAAASAPVADEKSEYKVTLKDAGAEKIKTIKALRQVLPTLGLVEAKKAVDEAPTVIAEAASKDDAKKMKEALEAAGAKVELS